MRQYYSVDDSYLMVSVLKGCVLEKKIHIFFGSSMPGVFLIFFRKVEVN